MRLASGPGHHHFPHDQDFFGAVFLHGSRNHAALVIYQCRTRSRLLSISPRLEMSNYPPPPPFGGPFNSTAHFTQSMSSNLPGIPQFPYGSLQKSFPPAGGALDAPYANAYYFDKNRQEIINTPNTITNAGFPSTTMDEIPNTAVSQSHAEPITYSSHPVSRETPHFTQHSTSAPSNTQHSDPQHRLGLANQIEAAMSPDTALPASAAAISDLEDGELSDDNGGEHSKVPSPGATSHDRVTVIPTELHSHGRHEYPGAVRHTAVVTAPAQRKGIHRWVSSEHLISANLYFVYRKKSGAPQVAPIVRSRRQQYVSRQRQA